jgi:hypothetical protein
MNGFRTSTKIVFLAGIAIVGIAVYQTIDRGQPDPYTMAALLTLAMGGGIGHVANEFVKGYVAKQVASDPARKEIGRQAQGNGAPADPAASAAEVPLSDARDGP